MMKNNTLFAIMAAVLTTPVVTAKEIPTRWFEVEVIVFTRTIPEGSIREEFEQKVNPIRYRRTRDLLTKFHYPDIKALVQASGLCSVEEMLHTPQPKIPTSFIFSAPDQVEGEFEAEPIQIDVAAFYNDAFIAPDLTEIPPEVEKDCKGNPVEFSWDDPYAFMRLDKYQDRNFDYHYDMYPRIIIAGEKRHNNYVHLMSPSNFTLREIYRTLRRQPDMRPVLHTAWRQPAGAVKYARATRLYAGIDYSQDYDFQGNPIVKDELLGLTTEDLPLITPEPVNVVDNIERLLGLVDQGAKINYQTQQIEPFEALDNSKDPTEVREVDGLLNIYVDHRNYLHIDAEFNVRREGIGQGEVVKADLSAFLSPDPAALSEPVGPLLNNYHFKQTRRVITQQLHYFDHPYMGLIVQIRRHGW
jgi:hypothetical protein